MGRKRGWREKERKRDRPKKNLDVEKQYLRLRLNGRKGNRHKIHRMGQRQGCRETGIRLNDTMAS